jgi:hypothetical protein
MRKPSSSLLRKEGILNEIEGIPERNATFPKDFANLLLPYNEELECISRLFKKRVGFANHWNGVSTHFVLNNKMTTCLCPIIAIKHQGRTELC